MRNRLLLIVTLLLIVSFVGACRPKPRIRQGGQIATVSTRIDLSQEPTIRILLARKVSAIELSSAHGLYLRNSRGISLARVASRRTVKIFQSPRKPDRIGVLSWRKRRGRLQDRRDEYPFRDAIIVEARGGDVIQLNGKTYPGKFHLIREGKHFTVVNYIPMEQYLEGVVPHEIGCLGRKGRAAMQVQAIAARTYAVQVMLERVGRKWDLVPDQRDQVYRGWEDRCREAARAVKSTRGQILALGGKPAEIYYSSTCGGHTVDIHRAWRHGPVAHLSGVRDADARGRSWCRNSRYFRWHHSWSARQLGEILRSYLPRAAGLPASTDIGYLQDVRIKSFSPDGRVQLLEVKTDRGVFAVRGDRVRTAMKRNLKGDALRSTMFRLSRKFDAAGRLREVSAVGAGWGHGIGLCQYGAIERSKAGQSARQILQAYFPGTKPRRLWP